MLEYLQSELGLAYRTRLTQHALQQYLDPPKTDYKGKGRAIEGGAESDPHAVALRNALENETGDNRGEQLFYKLANLDDRIKNADQVGAFAYVADDAVSHGRHTAVLQQARRNLFKYCKAGVGRDVGL
jgi:hypothetical protein